MCGIVIDVDLKYNPDCEGDLDRLGAKICDRIELFGLPEPDGIAHTGGGFHVIYLTPVLRYRDPKVAEMRATVMHAFRDALDGDKNALDAARTLRLAGSVNSKYEGERARVKIVVQSDRPRYTLEGLYAVALRLNKDARVKAFAENYHSVARVVDAACAAAKAAKDAAEGKPPKTAKKAAPKAPKSHPVGASKDPLGASEPAGTISPAVIWPGGLPGRRGTCARRLNDIEKIIGSWGPHGIPEGSRNAVLLIYAASLVWIFDDLEVAAREMARAVHRVAGLAHDWTTEEAFRYTGSVRRRAREEAAEGFKWEFGKGKYRYSSKRIHAELKNLIKPEIARELEEILPEDVLEARRAARKAIRDRKRSKTHHLPAEARESALQLLADGASLREVAEVVGVSKSAVAKWAAAARTATPVAEPAAEASVAQVTDPVMIAAGTVPDRVNTPVVGTKETPRAGVHFCAPNKGETRSGVAVNPIVSVLTR
jgi:DNA-directed RNA polymerase specialized sigma24 family protein